MQGRKAKHVDILQQKTLGDIAYYHVGRLVTSFSFHYSTIPRIKVEDNDRVR